MDTPRVSASFRRQLKRQLPVLQADEILSEEQSAAISAKYRLDSLAAESTSALLMAVYLIGAALIGIGVISFVAAHWETISRPAKLCLLMTAMLAAHGTGFYLWRVSGAYPRLGHSLVVLGTLIFGANIGLFAQIFHISGQWNGMFLPWAIGAIVVAYAAPSVPNAVIAVVTSFIWFCGGLGWGIDVAWWYPLAAAIVFVPYCFRNRSGLTLALALPAIGFATIACAGESDQGAYAVLLAFLAFGPACCGFGLLTGRLERFRQFEIPAVAVGLLSALIGWYANSFLEVAEETIRDYSPIHAMSEALLLPTAIMAALGCALAVAALASRRCATPLKILMILQVVSLAGFALVPLAEGYPVGIAVCCNLAFLGSAACLIWQSFLVEDRRIFWPGILLVAALVLGRTLEYETGLLIKSVAFTGCGIAVIVAGVAFERFLRSRRLAHV